MGHGSQLVADKTCVRYFWPRGDLLSTVREDFVYLNVVEFRLVSVSCFENLFVLLVWFVWFARLRLDH